uniref:Syntaxin N-terminal domain-containing protein n=1 Tax=Oryza nivara TaxID=4536 RepID=A0A0E0GHU0_ORYNI
MFIQKAWRTAAFGVYGFTQFTKSGFVEHAKKFREEDMQIRLDGKNCLVTGANSGIGFATAEGLASRLELNFAVNVAATYTLTELVMPLLEKAAPDARVITVSSGGMYTEPLNKDLQFGENNFNGTQQYARNKRVQVALTERWSEKCSNKGVGFYSMHPGWADTPGVSKSLPGLSENSPIAILSSSPSNRSYVSSAHPLASSLLLLLIHKRSSEMNDLFSSSSFKKYADASPASGVGGSDMEAGGEGVVNLDRFFEDVEGVKEDMKGLEALYKRLQSTNEETKTAHDARAVKALRSRMDGDVEQVLRRAKAVKGKLEALDRDNATSRKVPGCGPGSSTDRTRTSVVAGLGKKLKDIMDDFQV